MNQKNIELNCLLAPSTPYMGKRGFGVDAGRGPGPETSYDIYAENVLGLDQIGHHFSRLHICMIFVETIEEAHLASRNSLRLRLPQPQLQVGPSLFVLQPRIPPTVLGLLSPASRWVFMLWPTCSTLALAWLRILITLWPSPPKARVWLCTPTRLSSPTVRAPPRPSSAWSRCRPRRTRRALRGPCRPWRSPLISWWRIRIRVEATGRGRRLSWEAA